MYTLHDALCASRGHARMESVHAPRERLARAACIGSLDAQVDPMDAHLHVAHRTSLGGIAHHVFGSHFGSNSQTGFLEPADCRNRLAVPLSRRVGPPPLERR